MTGLVFLWNLIILMDYVYWFLHRYLKVNMVLNVQSTSLKSRAFMQNVLLVWLKVQNKLDLLFSLCRCIELVQVFQNTL